MQCVTLCFFTPGTVIGWHQSHAFSWEEGKWLRYPAVVFTIAFPGSVCVPKCSIVGHQLGPVSNLRWNKTIDDFNWTQWDCDKWVGLICPVWPRSSVHKLNLQRQTLLCEDRSQLSKNGPHKSGGIPGHIILLSCAAAFDTVLKHPYESSKSWVDAHILHIFVTTYDAFSSM